MTTDWNRMLAEPLLESFPALRTRDVDEVRGWLSRIYAIRSLDIPARARAVDCVVNHRTLTSTALTYARYGAPIHARLEQSDFFVQGFPLSGSGQVEWNRQTLPVDPQRGGVAGAPGSNATIDYSGDFSHIVLRITPAALIHRLSLLLDRPIDPPLQFNGAPRARNAGAYARLVRFVAQELGRHEDGLPALVLEELEDALLVNYLFANEHNYSELLGGPARAAAPWQVRRAVDYIEQHWDQPITIEQLTRITETSARSLFLMFKKTYDVSPMVYLSQVRLRHARQLLSQPTQDTSVTRVGFMCGFSNMGNFAQKYYGAFGERPSETLKTNRK